MAAKKGAQLVDVNTLLSLSEIGQDGLHPTEAGYQHLAEIWLDVIDQIREGGYALGRGARGFRGLGVRAQVSNSAYHDDARQATGSPPATVPSTQS